MASATDPDGQTLPWSQDLPAAVAARAAPRRGTLLHPSVLVLAAVSAGLAAWSLWPLLRAIVAGTELDPLPRAQLLAGLASGLACVVLLASAVAMQWRRQRQSGRTLRLTAHHLRRGAWESAVNDLRLPRRAVPSAFADLATQVEGVLGESERRWQALAELSSDWYWETDERGRLSKLSADAPIVKPAGRALGDVLGRRHDQLDFLQPPDGGWDAFHDMFERHERFRNLEIQVEGLGQRPMGWVVLTGRPRFRRDGRYAGYEGVGSDVSEQKLAFGRLQASEQRYAVMAGLSADWYWVTDARHRFAPADSELLRRFGDLARRIEGLTRWEAYADALSPAQWQAHREELDARRSFRALEFAVRRDDGRSVWISLAGAPRHDAAGVFVGYHGVGRDITLRKMAETMLVKHNRELQHAVAARTRELELANRDLDAFARQLAHELRTPIGQVQSLTDLLTMRLAGRLQPDETTLLELQRRASVDMLATLDALLELARSATDGIEREELDLSALALEVIAELPSVERSSPVLWDLQPGLSAWASRAQMRIVLNNLLGNAAKFTRHAQQPVVSLTGQHDSQGLLTLKVSDNGAGFDASRAERLFQPFQRLHRADEFQGTGIGLTIVQRIVQRHGGQISANGSLGRGASFEFTLGQRTR